MDIQLTLNDWIGFLGVAILLVAFLLQLSGKISKDSWLYIICNILGAGLACLASWMINYLPFVLLEGTWTLVSLVALTGKLLKLKKNNSLNI